VRAPGIISKILPLILMKGSAKFGLWGRAGGELCLGSPLSCFLASAEFAFLSGFSLLALSRDLLSLEVQIEWHPGRLDPGTLEPTHAHQN
jgi:hypothetical protein